MTLRYYANNAPSQTLASSITNSATSLTVAGSFSGWPTQFPFYATIDFGQLAEEIVLVTNIVGTTATITRAQDGTAAVSHTAGAAFDFSVVAQDYRDANTHVNSNTGVHGVSGSVVGTSDTQTLTNKTVSGGTLTGTIAASGATLTSPTLTSPSTTGGTLTTPTISNPSVTNSLTVSTGNLVVTAGNATVSGYVTGVHVSPSYANEAAATAAFPSPGNGATVWLTTPTTGGTTAGLFFWDGTTWQPVSVGAHFIGEVTDPGPVTLSTTAAFASSTSITFTLTEQRRVRIYVQARYQLGSTTAGRLTVQAGYNSGASAVIGSFIQVGQPGFVQASTSGTAGTATCNCEGTVLLAAGQYTAYVAVTRTNGQATDTANAFQVIVEDVGKV